MKDEVTPRDHLGAYQIRMELDGVKDVIMCRTFPLILGGTART